MRDLRSLGVIDDFFRKEKKIAKEKKRKSEYNYRVDKFNHKRQKKKQKKKNKRFSVR